MIYSLAIVALVLSHMWLVVPLFGPERWLSAGAIVAILGLCAWRNRREGEGWGFRSDAMAPGLCWAVAMTLPVVALVIAAGWALETFQAFDHMLLRFALLFVWALVQQFVLQTVIFREARKVYSPGKAVVLAAGLFALVHLPNPFLVPATFLAGLGWCQLYDRHPHLVPLALSHAAASLAALTALGPGITGGMRVGYGYLIAHGSWF